MAKHASDEEMERIIRDVYGFVVGGDGAGKGKVKGEGGYDFGVLGV